MIRAIGILAVQVGAAFVMTMAMMGGFLVWLWVTSNV